MGGVGRNRGGGSGGARSGTGPKPKPGAKKRIRKKATVPAAASAVAAALTKDSQPAAGRIQGCSSFNTGYYSVTARAASERVATATTPAAQETPDNAGLPEAAAEASKLLMRRRKR